MDKLKKIEQKLRKMQKFKSIENVVVHIIQMQDSKRIETNTVLIDLKNGTTNIIKLDDVEVKF